MGAVKSERGAPPHRPYPKLSPPGAVPSKTSGDPQFVHVHVTQRKSSPRLVTFRLPLVVVEPDGPVVVAGRWRREQHCSVTAG